MACVNTDRCSLSSGTMALSLQASRARQLARAASPGGGAGHLDPRNLCSVLRNVLGACNVMTDTWAALATLSAAELSEASASWPLLRELDILSAADVIVTLVHCSTPPPPHPSFLAHASLSWPGPPAPVPELLKRSLVPRWGGCGHRLRQGHHEARWPGGHLVVAGVVQARPASLLQAGRGRVVRGGRVARGGAGGEGGAGAPRRRAGRAA